MENFLQKILKLQFKFPFLCLMHFHQWKTEKFHRTCEHCQRNESYLYGTWHHVIDHHFEKRKMDKMVQELIKNDRNK